MYYWTIHIHPLATFSSRPCKSLKDMTLSHLMTPTRLKMLSQLKAQRWMFERDLHSSAMENARFAHFEPMLLRRTFTSTKPTCFRSGDSDSFGKMTEKPQSIKDLAASAWHATTSRKFQTRITISVSLRIIISFRPHALVFRIQLFEDSFIHETSYKPKVTRMLKNKGFHVKSRL